MFESESGENSSSMLENVTSEIFHCPCPQVKKCEPTNVYKCIIIRFRQDVRNVSFDDCRVNCTEGEEVMVDMPARLSFEKSTKISTNTETAMLSR